MSIHVAQKTIDYIFSDPRFLSEESITFDFIGGEPLLEIDLIDNIIEYFLNCAEAKNHRWKENYRLRITTNGLLYSSQPVQEFIRKYHSHLDISISIDGNEVKTNSARIFPDGTGSYSELIKSIPLWRRQFPGEGTKMTISHDDLPYVYESVRHLISLGIYKIDINPVLEDVWKCNDDKLLEDQLVLCADYILDNHLEDTVDLSCFEERLGIGSMQHDTKNYGICGGFTFAVDYKGDFYTCLRFANFSLKNQEERSIGNVEEGINWNRMRPFQVFCNQITSDNCMKCEVHAGCKICPAENYDRSLSSTIYEQSMSACLMHKAKVRAKNYYWNKLQFAR